MLDDEEKTSIKTVNIPETTYERLRGYEMLFQEFFKEVAKQGASQAIFRLGKQNRKLKEKMKNVDEEEQEGVFYGGL